MTILSLLLSLSCTTSVPILGALGRPASAWFLRLVTSQNPTLGADLHNGQGLKPFTVSTLLDGRGRTLQAGRWLQPGEECWLRITTLREDVSNLLLRTCLKGKLPGHLELYKMSFRLQGWTLDPAQHPWAGQSSFQDLAQQYQPDRNSRLVRLEFASPTAFRKFQADLPLPVPGSVFRSYYEKWNALAPEELHIQDLWPEFAARCIFVSELSGLNTERWVFAEGSHGAATGFVGIVGFHLMPKQHSGELSDVWDGADGVLQSLARFAFYSGTGHHTTIGLGQTRLLPNLKADQRRAR